MQFTNLAVAATAILAIAQPVVSTIFVTNPVQSTKVTGGKKVSIEWHDDGNAPKLSSDWGSVNIYLAVGSRTTQFKIQTLATGLSTKKKSGRYTIDKNVGTNMNKYFIRFEGTKLGADGNPPLAFSALFSLTGMSGPQFNSTVQAAIDAQTGTTSATGAAAGSIKPSTSTTKPLATPISSPATAANKNGSSDALLSSNVNFALVSVGALAAAGGAYLL